MLTPIDAVIVRLSVYIGALESTNSQQAEQINALNKELEELKQKYEELLDHAAESDKRREE